MHFICKSDDIKEGQSRGFSVNDLAIFGIKKNGKYYFYKNACPHLGTELEWEENKFLDNSGELIICNTHGAEFRIEDGHCIYGPCSGEMLEPVPIAINEDSIYLSRKE